MHTIRFLVNMAKIKQRMITELQGADRQIRPQMVAQIKCLGATSANWKSRRNQSLSREERVEAIRELPGAIERSRALPTINCVPVRNAI
jgi:hypothetical protein